MSVLPDFIASRLQPHAGWASLLAALLLTLIGVAAIYTVEPGYASLTLTRWIPLAGVMLVLAMLPSPRVIGELTWPLAALALALLVLVVLPFVPRTLVPRINGATSWINLGLMNFQPAEMAKVFFVLSLAWYLRYRENHRTLLGLLVPFVLMGVPVLLILKQPDLGSALLLAPTLFVMLVAAGAKLRHLGALLSLGLLAVVIVAAVTVYAPDYSPLKPHQQDRIRSMLALASGDDRYNQTSAFQQSKAMTLIGAGGVAGYGEERSAVILEYNRLPEDHNDMIFAVIVNRWGLLGALLTLSLYAVLVLGVLLVAARSKDPFARLSCVGFAGMIFTQATINMGMTVGLLPITGITLPFISYGGSSLLFSYAMIGLVMNFASRRPQHLARPSFEFDHADALFQ